jgi:hypothetical protein
MNTMRARDMTNASEHMHKRDALYDTVFKQLLRVDGYGANESGAHGQHAVGENGYLVSRRCEFEALFNLEGEGGGGRGREGGGQEICRVRMMIEAATAAAATCAKSLSSARSKRVGTGLSADELVRIYQDEASATLANYEP